MPPLNEILGPEVTESRTSLSCRSIEAGWARRRLRREEAESAAGRKREERLRSDGGQGYQFMASKLGSIKLSFMLYYTRILHM